MNHIKTDGINMNPVMVSIHCLVYNQAPYLRQCLDGFVNQKTKFKFEAIVHDDVSIDGSRDIIKEYAQKYPDIIKPVFETENQYSKNDGSLEKSMFPYLRGKYMAICEGDDYWTDPYKLQKQFNILEGNDAVELCYTRSKVFYEDKQSFANYLNADKGPTDFVSIMFKEPAITLTSFFRTKSYKDYWNDIQPGTKGWLMGDTPLFLWLSHKGSVVLLDDVTAVYRMLGESASHSSNIEKQLRFNKSTLDIRLYFCEKYGRNDLISALYDTYFRSNMYDAYRNSPFKLFFENFNQIKHKSYRDYIYLLSHIKHCILNR